MVNGWMNGLAGASTESDHVEWTPSWNMRVETHGVRLKKRNRAKKIEKMARAV